MIKIGKFIVFISSDDYGKASPFDVLGYQAEWLIIKNYFANVLFEYLSFFGILKLIVACRLGFKLISWLIH